MIRCNRKREAIPWWVKGLSWSSSPLGLQPLRHFQQSWLLDACLFPLSLGRTDGCVLAGLTWGRGVRLLIPGDTVVPDVYIYIYVFNKIKRPISSHLKSCLHSDFYVLQWVSAFDEYPWNFPKRSNLWNWVISFYNEPWQVDIGWFGRPLFLDITDAPTFVCCVDFFGMIRKTMKNLWNHPIRITR